MNIPVLDYLGRYTAGFDPNKVYRFTRDGKPAFVGKLADTDPAMNVAGLCFSGLPEELSVEGEKQ